jgi:hypothetical protein
VGGVEEAGAELGVDGVRVDSLFFFFYTQYITVTSWCLLLVRSARRTDIYINGTQGRRLAGNS